jgi:hypothetical protein
MKKIIIIFLAALVPGIFIFIGCVKLKETPPGQLAPDNFYHTESDFDAAVIGAYQPLFQGYSAFDFHPPILVGSGAEDVTTRPQKTDGKAFDEFTETPDNDLLNTCWTMCYHCIQNCNGILGNISNAQSFPADKLNAYQGQAKFLRALCYFYLVRWFGNVPLINETNYQNAAQVPEDSVAVIYKQIVKDLQDAETELPASFPGEKGRATSGAAQGLLAKVYLTMAGWPILDQSNYALAKAEADKVITAGNYSLDPVFSDLWLAKNKFTNPEFIFTLSGLGSSGWIQGSHHHVSTRPSNEGGWDDWFSEARFYNEFPNGPRKDASFHTVFEDGTQWQNGQYAQPYISKYRDAGPAAGFTGPINSPDGEGFFCLLRYADVLLMYAEAANMADGSPSAQAYECINKVRRRANGVDPNVANPLYDLVPGLSKEAFDDSVIAERNWELAFEDNRWFDLVRKQMVVSVNKGLYPNVDAHNMLLPKPSTEIQLLKGLLKQNPGY